MAQPIDRLQAWAQMVGWSLGAGHVYQDNEVYTGTTYGNRDYEVKLMRWCGGRSTAERQCHHTRHWPRYDWLAEDVPPIVSGKPCARVQALRPLRQADSRRHHTRRDCVLRTRGSSAVCGLGCLGTSTGAQAHDSCHGHPSRVYAGLAQQECNLHAHQQQHFRVTDLCANINAFCESLQAGLHTPDFARRRQIVEVLVD